MNAHNALGTNVSQEQPLTVDNNHILDSTPYFKQLAKVLEDTKDKQGRIETILNFKNEFLEKYNKFFNQSVNEYMLSELRKAFTVGQFYETKVVKQKLKSIYNNEFTPAEFYKRTPKMIDLQRYKWFKFVYKSLPDSDEHLKGIQILSSFI